VFLQGIGQQHRGHGQQANCSATVYNLDSASSGHKAGTMAGSPPGPIEEVRNSSPLPPEAATSQDRLASLKRAVAGDREYLTSSSSSLSALEQALPAKDVRRQGCPHPRFADSYFIGAGAASIKPNDR